MKKKITKKKTYNISTTIKSKQKTKRVLRAKNKNNLQKLYLNSKVSIITLFLNSIYILFLENKKNRII